jgi:hypothetical protein
MNSGVAEKRNGKPDMAFNKLRGKGYSISLLIASVGLFLF